MTLRNDELAERFVRGAESGSASRMEIKTLNDTRYVLGYGWAVYAAVTPGNYYLFGDGYKSDRSNVGWAGYSGTTTKHIQVLKRALEDAAGRYSVLDYRLEESEITDMAPEAVPVHLNGIHRAHGQEPLEYTGYLYRRDE